MMYSDCVLASKALGQLSRSIGFALCMYVVFLQLQDKYSSSYLNLLGEKGEG